MKPIIRFLFISSLMLSWVTDEKQTKVRLHTLFLTWISLPYSWSEMPWKLRKRKFINYFFNCSVTFLIQFDMSWFVNIFLRKSIDCSSSIHENNSFHVNQYCFYTQNLLYSYKECFSLAELILNQFFNKYYLVLWVEL